jgi:hypothetical protein
MSCSSPARAIRSRRRLKPRATFISLLQTTDLVPGARFCARVLLGRKKGSGRQNKGRPDEDGPTLTPQQFDTQSLAVLVVVIRTVRPLTSSTWRGGPVTHAARLAVTPPAAVFAPPRTGVTCQCDRNEADRGQHPHGQNDPKPVVIHRPPHATTPFEAISQTSLARLAWIRRRTRTVGKRNESSPASQA